ncbi:MAG TPA: hypothetical protein VE860_15460 [Chthoniobacterales bacterium]|jgi:hypothetical protein|nr:hypothetical protein [Chthoniobacterales bacterium]
MGTKHRTHLIGIDKPTKDSQATLEQQAKKHEINRLESVAETIALVGALTFQKVLSGREQLTVVGAGFQWGRGTVKTKTVAAHCLPGQLEFNSRPIQTMPNWKEASVRECGFKPLALSSKLRNLSARSDVVDVIVNQTDSLLERMRDGIPSADEGCDTRFPVLISSNATERETQLALEQKKYYERRI